MKKNLSLRKSTYRGRFAPSPTGPLHFGSLVAAVGSYLDAKHQHGTWLVRMEDLDTPRCVPGATDDILRTLEAFGLHSDEPILYQSQRTAAYVKALSKLQASCVAYPCCCTRKEIADSALNGIEGPIYPGTCRNGIPVGQEGKAWRVRTDISSTDKSVLSKVEGLGANCSVGFEDALQGRISQHLESEIGDFVVKRADGLFAYQLAVVVDDTYQNITHIVRGADLLDSTLRQIYLLRLLGLRVPNYMHLPVAVNGSGEKLGKQTLAAPVDESHPVRTLLRVLEFLRQQPPAELTGYDIKAVLDWAINNWDATKLRGIQTLPAI